MFKKNARPYQNYTPTKSLVYSLKYNVQSCLLNARCRGDFYIKIAENIQHKTYKKTVPS